FGRRTGLAGGVIAAALLLGTTIAAAEEAGKKIKIGVVYDYSGPMAAGGSELHALGTKIMIDYFNRKGGIEGYQIEPVYADAQSKPEVAINEVVRLIEQEKVDILLGFFSSAQCVPVAARVDQVKKFMWITTCISSAVLENRHLKYVFRAQPSGRQFGLASTGSLQRTRGRNSARRRRTCALPLSTKMEHTGSTCRAAPRKALRRQASTSWSTRAIQRRHPACRRS